MGCRGQDEALEQGSRQGGLGRAREQHPSASCIPRHSCLPVALLPPSPVPGAPGAIAMGTGVRAGQQGSQALLPALVLVSVDQ